MKIAKPRDDDFDRGTQPTSRSWMRRSRTVAFCGVAIAVGALLAACGGGGDPPAEPARTLTERIFAGSVANVSAQQQLIRECMTSEGFEYSPSDVRGGSSSGVEGFDSNSEDFVKEYGFGISTLFSSDISIVSSDDDPNTKYRNSLGEAQRVAYDAALYGDSETHFGATGGSGSLLSATGSGGCAGAALKASGADVQRFDVSLFNDLSDLEDRINADPEMVEARQEWAACMAESGYQYRDQDQAEAELREEFAEVAGLETSGSGGGFLIGGGGSDEDGFGDAFDPLANADKEQLADLQDRERRIALDSYECSQKHIVKVEQPIRERLSAQFLDDHPELGLE